MSQSAWGPAGVWAASEAADKDQCIRGGFRSNLIGTGIGSRRLEGVDDDWKGAGAPMVARLGAIVGHVEDLADLAWMLE